MRLVYAFSFYLSSLSSRVQFLIFLFWDLERFSNSLNFSACCFTVLHPFLLLGSGWLALCGGFGWLAPGCLGCALFLKSCRALPLSGGARWARSGAHFLFGNERALAGDLAP